MSSSKRKYEKKYLKKYLLSYKKSVNKKRLPEQAYEILRKAIKNLHLKPYESFLEREIAEMLEMSRTPIREALIRLEMNDWVQLIPRKGFSVKPISKENIKQIFQIVEVLEGLAAKLATNNMDAASLEKLNILIDEQEKYMHEDDLNAYVEVDEQFHNLIIERSQNTRLKRVIESHSDQMYRVRLFTIKEREFPVRSINEHKAIVAAMRARDEQAAELLLHSHRVRGGREILDILKSKL